MKRAREVLRSRLVALFCSAATCLSGCQDVTTPVDEYVEPVLLGAGDLQVGWISRQPALDYVENSGNPRVEGWPPAGSPVTWYAHLRNWSDRELRVGYRWLLDGGEQRRGSIKLAPGSTDSVPLRAHWTFDRHELRFELNGGGNREIGQDTLTVFTDALAVAFYVEQPYHDYFRMHQPSIGISSYSFEHFAQRHIARFNEMAAAAIYAETPNGVLDRFRLDRVVVVGDGRLPIGGGSIPVNLPNLADRVADMQWGFPTTNIQTFRPFVESLGPQHGLWGPFEYHGSLLHELGHARYLIDVYQYNVYHGTADSRVDVQENGAAIVNTPYLPAKRATYNRVEGWNVHTITELGLMNAQYDHIDRYSAIALNLIAGHRATQGNYNGPGNLGVFMNDLPAENRLLLQDASGSALAGAHVTVYRGVGVDGATSPYARIIDDAPDMHLTADASGHVLLGRNPFSETGAVERGATVILLRVAHENRVGYAFFEHYKFNLEYWRGHHSLAEYTLSVPMITTSN